MCNIVWRWVMAKRAGQEWEVEEKVGFRPNGSISWQQKAVENVKQDMAGRKPLGLQENNTKRNKKTFRQQFSGHHLTLLLSLSLC